jgi:hypothetical protein
MAWQHFVARISKESKPELVKYLKHKMLYINEPLTDETEDI